MAQLKNALQPCIADVQIKWGKNGQYEGSASLEVEVETKKTLFGYGKQKKKMKFSVKNQVPSKIPPIYDGNRLIVYKQIAKSFDNNEEVSIKAKTPEGDLEHTFNITLDSFIEGNSLHQLFARKMIQDLEEKQKLDEEDSKALITELGLKYNIASISVHFLHI